MYHSKKISGKGMGFFLNKQQFNNVFLIFRRIYAYFAVLKKPKNNI